MNRSTPMTMRRLRPRTAVVSGAALGLIAGATVYGAVSSSAEAPATVAFKAKPPVAVAHAAAANCARTSKLEKGVCVVHVVRTVVLPPSAASVAAAARAAVAAVPAKVAKSAVRPTSAASHEDAPSKAAPAADAAAGRESDDAPETVATPAKAPVPTPTKTPTRTPVGVSAAAPTPVPTAAS